MEIIKFETIDSTQNYAKNLVLKGETDKIICADIQTAGRGRIGNEWQSLSGGLWFSFVTDISDLDVEKIEVFTLILGVSIYQACTSFYNIKLQLKWPNDLLLNGKKVCGILCEKVENKVISGVGINTNIDSEDLIECGTTFFKETGVFINNLELLNSIIDKFYENLNNFNKEELFKIYKTNMAYLDEKKFIKIVGKEATIKGIDDNGALIIDDNGLERKITFGEI